MMYSVLLFTILCAAVAAKEIICGSFFLRHIVKVLPNEDDILMLEDCCLSNANEWEFTRPQSKQRYAISRNVFCGCLKFLKDDKNVKLEETPSECYDTKYFESDETIEEEPIRIEIEVPEGQALRINVEIHVKRIRGDRILVRKNSTNE